MTHILLIDDHSVYRQGLKQLLAAELGEVVFAEAGGAEEGLRLGGAPGLDLVILDISLPDGSGLDVLKTLRGHRPELPILVLSMYPESQFAARALRAGARGYLSKQALPAELVAAARVALAGEHYAGRALAALPARAVGSHTDQAPHELLSDREFEVFRALALGKTVKAIARELHLSVPTISTYRTRILDKMGLVENSDLTQYALVYRILVA